MGNALGWGSAPGRALRLAAIAVPVAVVTPAVPLTSQSSDSPLASSRDGQRTLMTSAVVPGAIEPIMVQVP